jgi:hypothetical protein
VLPGGVSISNTWYTPLLKVAAICWPSERIAFYGPGARGCPVHCVIAYLGADVLAFHREFERIGAVQVPLTWLRDATTTAGTSP